MKLFGHKKRRKDTKYATSDGRFAPQPYDAPYENNELPPERIGSRARAWVLLLIAATVCVSAITMCLVLTNRQVEASQQKGERELTFKLEKGKTEQPTVPDATVVTQTPVSVNNSDKLNILLFGVDAQTNEAQTVILLNINTQTKEVALLSFPRDTFVSGNYREPRLSHVFSEAKNEERGIFAMKEAVKSMTGFAVDYYFILDEASVTAAVNCLGDISFEVPAEPAYSTLAAGTQTLNGKDAYALLCFDGAYTEVGAEPTQVQRRLLQQLLDTLLTDADNRAENAVAIAAAAKTDLSAEHLVYLGELLQKSRFAAGFSRALPGVVIEAGGMEFYQVNPEEALPLLNASFNPLETELTVFNLNFRQYAGDSTDGEISPFGFSHNNDDDDDDDDDSSTDPTEPVTEPESTTPPEPQPTDAPTEP